ncbi:MAG: class I SAM-dependent methyltransferase [Candidatus Sumerlaeota bacterium]|nr:class I SAM-dependent methyltransferase [Candidatus Sumerlaeota bacterium]
MSNEPNVEAYRRFFQGVALEFWRKIVPAEQTRAEAEFLWNALGARPGMRLLDVPCGSGRHSLELAARGCLMTGVDLSEECIDEARRAAENNALSIEWRLGDMRALPWTAEFDGAFCFGNSFGYFERGGMRAFLGAVTRALRPGARFVVETGMAAESILPNLGAHFQFEAGDLRLAIENRYEAGESRLDTDYTFLRGGGKETRRLSHWIYTVSEIKSLMAEAGLATMAMFGSLSREPYKVRSRFLYVVAERAAHRLAD